MPKRRLTIQKIKILEYLKSVKTHPTAETIYDTVKKELPTITLATVYRNLNLLNNEGKIRRLNINNNFNFDADISTHQHCICKKCSKIYDIFQKEISKYALNKIQLDNFEPSSVNVIFYGICKKCKKA
ncbi:MAG: transcriptional repressor [Flavobacteriales bacterium]|jgi:Fur family peroxide stress response transcriptional regulator|nr:transcriptional repressor [Flavobacteriales bacterium]|tara:strand:+ start:777 stop:1160 length:384 start_codon:yes stop_codon:yes gene_type:complete